MPETESPSTAGSGDLTFTLRIDKRAGLVICIAVLTACTYLASDWLRRPAVSSADANTMENAPPPAATQPVNRSPATEVFNEPENPVGDTEPVYEEPQPVQEIYAPQIYAPQVTEVKVRNETRIGPVVYVDKPVASAPAPRAVAPTEPRASTTGTVSLNGAGATFPAVVYQKWFSEYHNIRPEVTFAYQAIGSGGGVKQMQAATLDFGATDWPATDEQLAAMPVPILQIPTVMGAVVLIYNVPGITQALRFTPEVIAGIFLGNIRKWNDPAIVSVNPGLLLPETDIVVVHRSDGSAPTHVFTDYLSKVSPEWQAGVGQGPSVRWPTGLGGKGCDGIAGTVKQTPGAIGYVELTWALTEKITMGLVRNASGQFISPSLESVQAAAAGVLPEDLRVSITNPPGKEAYPISSFTWLLVPATWKDSNKKRAFTQFLTWMVDSGEAMVPALDYAPLPRSVVVRVKREIRQIE